MLLEQGPTLVGHMYQPTQKGNVFPPENKGHYSQHLNWDHLRKDGALIRPIAERPGMPCMPMMGQLHYGKEAPRATMPLQSSTVGLPAAGVPRLTMPYSVPLPAYHSGQLMPKFLPKFLPMAAFMMPSKYPLGKKTFRCTQCRYLTDRKNNLKRHIATMHADCGKTLECCDVIFKSKAALRDHVLLFHRSGYKCRFCARNFCRKALLKRHLAVHNGQKDYGCGNCEYTTSHKSNLERHRKVHGFEGPDTDDELDSDSWHDDSIDEGSTEEERTEVMDLSMEGSSEGHSVGRKCRKSLFSLPDRLRETHSHGDPCETVDQIEKDDESEVITEEEDRRLSSDIPGDSDSPLSRRRLFATPYKCPECGLCFSSQQLLCLHAGGCRDQRQDPIRPVTTIVRPFLDYPGPARAARAATTETCSASHDQTISATQQARTTFNIADLLPFTLIPPTYPPATTMEDDEPVCEGVQDARDRSPSPDDDKQLPLKKRVLSPQ